MNEPTVTIIHVLLTSILALGPLSIAFYLDLKQNREAEQERQ